MSPMVRRSPGIELALLGFLRQGPQHGYQIHQLVSDPDGLGPIWSLKQSQLYALLAKLEKDGYIWGEVEAQEAARPPRRMFQLTQSGQAAYQVWLKTPVSVPRLVRQEFIAKYYFARREGESQARILIDSQRAICREWLEMMKAGKKDQASFSWLIQQYRIGQIEAALTWLESV
ncbi:MAG: PadR family transcriptional regulator [Chloroflexi bacterium]|nr:PadR family transcriptional regulator [Chloroflexota bacterium]